MTSYQFPFVPLEPAGHCPECGCETTETGICDDCYRDEYGCLCGPHYDGRPCNAMEVDA